MVMSERLKKKMSVLEIPIWGGYLRSQWETHFASHLSEKDKEDIFLNDEGGYLWHLFSYNRKEHLEKSAAIQAFIKQPKGSCFLFYQHSNYALRLENADKLTIQDLHDQSDVYIVSVDFSWTYVVTHEKDWLGPYFSRLTS
ncbi:ATP synthase F1 subunit delta [Paenibacillus glycanilyticus]|uniref:ATP synthase F1 subunit delta n=1 Tax=Paenibacillus glycanilyticus TaxID=126569 RepID=A0ABQ6NQF2_9BACL|nr:DUF4275 family protein [Paenibacillus glycanilyticus]GMK47004.1 ATP synthase F1 subunit delta [Paenibacillus glycanilyticus]